MIENTITRKSIHMRFDIGGALSNWPLSRFKGLLKDDQGRTMPPRKAKASLLEEYGKGVRYLPIGKCDNFDPANGCLGHPMDGQP